MIANIITALRIVFAGAMIFCPVFSPQFFGVYIAAGISDMIDGTVARKTGSSSEFGAKLDSIADLFFVAAAGVKIFPQISLPKFIWIWTGVIAVVKIARIITACIRQNKFYIPHSIANKITGFLLFIFPLTIPFVDLRVSAGIVCAVATVVAVYRSCGCYCGGNSATVAAFYWGRAGDFFLTVRGIFYYFEVKS